jgi:hypothetical protein
MILPAMTENKGSNPRAEYPRRIKSGAFFREYAPAGKPDPDRGCPAKHHPDATWGISLSSFGTIDPQN